MDTVMAERPILTYVVAYPEVGRVKIGQAQYYGDGMMQLRNGSPIEPVPVCAFVGAHHEKELHDLFKHLRVRLEYFEDTPELRAHLEQRAGRITHAEALAMSPLLSRNKVKSVVKKSGERPAAVGAQDALQANP